MTHKLCKFCNEDFLVEHANQKFCCEMCRVEARRVYKLDYYQRKEVKARMRNSAADWRSRNYVQSRLNTIKNKSKEIGVEFNLAVEDIVVPTHCPALGLELDGHDSNHTWTIDRLIPELGYIPENIRIISGQANRLKNNSTLWEMRALLAYMEREIAILAGDEIPENSQSEN